MAIDRVTVQLAARTVDVRRPAATDRGAGGTAAPLASSGCRPQPLRKRSVGGTKRNLTSCCLELRGADKAKVVREVARVLRPGGRVSMSDIVVADDFPGLPAMLRADTTLLAAEVGGAVREAEYLAAITDTGLVDVRVVDRAPYQRETTAAYLREVATKAEGERLSAFMGALAAGAAGKVKSVGVTGRKPRP